MPARILIVDDSPTIRALHGYILQSAGFDTVEAESGFAALEALASTPCAVAVVDVNMPLMDGLTLIRHIRDDPATAKLPVVIVSTEQQEDDKRRGYEAGANVYVVKPTEPRQLIASVRMLATG